MTDANGGAIGGGWTFKPGEVAHLEIDDKDVYVDGDYLVSTGSGLKPISVVGFFEGGNWHVRYVEDHED
ncbi:MAG: hypothetical protein HY815_21650 [Candidatus Riflebacteria bacterium]|nr:hypothetical protein [Candidatus Riflebacteria bacterium]